MSKSTLTVSAPADDQSATDSGSLQVQPAPIEIEKHCAKPDKDVHQAASSPQAKTIPRVSQQWHWSLRWQVFVAADTQVNEGSEMKRPLSAS